MNRFVEKTVQLISVFKWVLLSTIVGVVVGVGASLFLIVLDWAIGFSGELAPYAAVACVISFLITGHRSVYPSQIIGFSKSHSINFELGGEIKGVEAEVMVRENSLLYHLTSMWKKKK